MHILQLIQKLLLPVAWLYEGVLRLRNFLYDSGFFGSTVFDLPTINIGNLAFGGTGKTPHAEYLLRLLQNSEKPAILSRGYGRKTRGYLFANESSTAFTLGDEPYQIYSKFPDIPVAVSENRVLGVPSLLMDAPDTNLIILDDAFQHRSIKPGLNILLTEFYRPYSRDYLFPSGYLREYRSASKRADLIIVTKCPDQLTADTREKFVNELSPEKNQDVFFSKISYGEPVSYFPGRTYEGATQAMGVAGIARPAHFEGHLKRMFSTVVFKQFRDHHAFTEDDLRRITEEFDQWPGSDKIILTTEKDYKKIIQTSNSERIKKYPFFYIPVEVTFDGSDADRFNTRIYEYLRSCH